MAKTKETIGQVIKRARVRKHLKAEEVAALCEVSRAMIYGWEHSVYVLPKNFRRLSEALDIPMKRLERVNGCSPERCARV